CPKLPITALLPTLLTTSAENATEEEPQPYDNAYFFILFVMLFYSFLALTVFFGYMRSKKEVQKKDPYEEFMEGKNQAKNWRPSSVFVYCGLHFADIHITPQL
uniref:Uncharacterized protein n=1 Tax=Xenopus tropicalis TaxID=8364 RepID=A0A6I8SFX7_XENTR